MYRVEINYSSSAQSKIVILRERDYGKLVKLRFSLGLFSMKSINLIYRTLIVRKIVLLLQSSFLNNKSRCICYIS